MSQGSQKCLIHHTPKDWEKAMNLAMEGQEEHQDFLAQDVLRDSLENHFLILQGKWEVDRNNSSLYGAKQTNTTS